MKTYTVKFTSKQALALISFLEADDCPALSGQVFEAYRALKSTTERETSTAKALRVVADVCEADEDFARALAGMAPDKVPGHLRVMADLDGACG